MILAVIALVPGAFAQTTKTEYKVKLFGAPPPGQDMTRYMGSATVGSSRWEGIDCRDQAFRPASGDS